MKRCPECRRDYVDDSLLYCLEDCAALVQGSVPSPDEPRTAILHDTAIPGEAATRAQIHTTSIPAAASTVNNEGTFPTKLIIAIAAVIIVLGGLFGLRYFTASAQINSIAVMPFVNESGNADVAEVYAGLGEKDKAFEWLEKDFQSKGALADSRWQICFDSLWSDPRYKNLLKRMNLPE